MSFVWKLCSDLTGDSARNNLAGVYMQDVVIGVLTFANLTPWC